MAPLLSVTSRSKVKTSVADNSGAINDNVDVSFLASSIVEPDACVHK